MSRGTYLLLALLAIGLGTFVNYSLAQSHSDSNLSYSGSGLTGFGGGFSGGHK